MSWWSRTCEELDIIISRPYITFSHFSIMMSLCSKFMIKWWLTYFWGLYFYSFCDLLLSSIFWNLKLKFEFEFGLSRMECHCILVSSKSFWPCSVIGFSFLSSSTINDCHVILSSHLILESWHAQFTILLLLYYLYYSSPLLSSPLISFYYCYCCPTIHSYHTTTTPVPYYCSLYFYYC